MFLKIILVVKVVMMVRMMMTMMTNTIPYRRTKAHIWDKVLMGIWVHPIMVVMVIMVVRSWSCHWSWS